MNKKNNFSNFENNLQKSLYIKKTIHYKNTSQNLYTKNYLYNKLNNYIQPYKKQHMER